MIITDKIILPDNISFEELAIWWCDDDYAIKHWGAEFSFVFLEQAEYTGLTEIASYNTLTREITEYEEKYYYGPSIIDWIKKASEEKNNDNNR